MFEFLSTSSGIKDKELDLAVIYSNQPFYAVATFTQNRVKAAPVVFSIQALKKFKKFQALLVNSGNANACTGEEGFYDCVEIEKFLRKEFNISKESGILMASTGVIGVRLPVKKILKGISSLKNSSSSLENFSKAIMTTDTFPKVCRIKKENIEFAGVAKGAGMIHPKMATMLAFITTDSLIEVSEARKILKKVVDKTFNSITVDGDTSTNDSVFLLMNPEKRASSRAFEEGLFEVCSYLSEMIVKDGEGATKVIKVSVYGASTEEDARKVAESVATSNLVKTAFFGNDPNWGRIVCAIGYSQVESVDPDRIDVYIENFKIVENGKEAPNFNETALKEFLEKSSKIEVRIELKAGTKRWDYLTCDLTYEYVRINAEYRT